MFQAFGLTGGLLLGLVSSMKVYLCPTPVRYREIRRGASDLPPARRHVFSALRPQRSRTACTNGRYRRDRRPWLCRDQGACQALRQDRRRSGIARFSRGLDRRPVARPCRGRHRRARSQARRARDPGDHQALRDSGRAAGLDEDQGRIRNHASFVDRRPRHDSTARLGQDRLCGARQRPARQRRVSADNGEQSACFERAAMRSLNYRED